MYEKKLLNQLYTTGHPEIAPYLQLTAVKDLPAYNTDMLGKDTLVNDQGEYGCCTGEAATGLFQLFDTLMDGAYTPLSVLYNYYYSRYILDGKVTGDEGSTILAAMSAMVKYGNAPDIDWPFTKGLNSKPNSKSLKDAKNYDVIKYFTVSEDSTADPNKNTKLQTLKQCICDSKPVMFGSMVRNSIMDVKQDGIEPYSEDDRKDPIAGGHARLIIGYDDTVTIPGSPIKGAFLVKNSWGVSWGLKGYSWVSYQVFIDQETDCMGIVSTNLPTPSPAPVNDCQSYKDVIGKIKDLVAGFLIRIYKYVINL